MYLNVDQRQLGASNNDGFLLFNMTEHACWPCYRRDTATAS